MIVELYVWIKVKKTVLGSPVQNLTHSSVKLAWGFPAWTEGLDKMTFGGHFQSQPFCDCYCEDLLI